MTPSSRKNRFRALSVAGLAVVAFLGTAPAVSADSEAAESACRQEIRRVAVWPRSPKAVQIVRFEKREVTVCNGKVVSEKTQRNASSEEQGMR